MDLTEKSDAITWPVTHYVFVENTGPFLETARPTWEALHRLVPHIRENNKVISHLSLVDPAPDKMIYRAGVSLTASPTKLPDGLHYEEFAGGKYVCFVLTGPYSDLPMACGMGFKLFHDKKRIPRPGFMIEHYVNDPKTTPEAELITEICIPTF